MAFLYCTFIISGIFFGDLWIKNQIEQGHVGQTDIKKENCDNPTENTLHHVHVLPEALCKNRILIRKYHNKGAMLNLGQTRSAVVTALSVILCILMTAVFLLSLGTRGNRLLRIGLSFLLGGSFSNTYDRLKRKYVVDYFSFNVKCKSIRRIVFNISDFCILIGTLLAVSGTP